MKKASKLFCLALALLSLLFQQPIGRTFASPAFVHALGPGLVGPDGRQFFVLGANYVGFADRAWRIWEDGLFDPVLIERDFRKARAAGLNTLRIFIREPLPAEIKAGRWEKLDCVIELARRNGLLLIVTLYDYQEDKLDEVAAVAKLVARRYAQESAILAYDLRNEPHFANLATAQYPQGIVPPLLTDVLIKRYGERISRTEVEAWRGTPEGQNLIPRRFTAEQAYILANNYRFYREFLDEAGRWVAARNWEVSTLDYIDSPDSSRWHPLLGVLDDTLSAWLSPQIRAIREVDANHLLTVGYSDVVLAKLSANRVLSFQSVHRYPGSDPKSFRVTLGVLANLRNRFPDQPQVVTEFGYSNASVDTATSALYEMGVFLHLLSVGAAGGMKWMLNDVAGGANARENNFGLYRSDEAPKPIVAALAALSAYLQNRPRPGQFQLLGQDELRYIFSGADVLLVGAREYQDKRVAVQSDRPAVVMFTWDEKGELKIQATENVRLSLDVQALTGGKEIEAQFELYRVAGGSRTKQPFEMEGKRVRFTAEGGQPYLLVFSRREADARIEIVWPHGGLPVREARLANVMAYIFRHGSRQPICASGQVKLWRALNNDLEEEVAIGQRRMVAQGDLRFPAWDFNNIDVVAARDPLNKYYFRVTVDGVQTYSTIWSHGEDARTYFPQPDVPNGVGSTAPEAVDARIEIVWPHDNLPVSEASKVNITVFLFEPGTRRSVAMNWNPVVRLWRALNNEPEEPVAVGEKVIRRGGELYFPAWDFNNIDVSAVRDPLNKYYFRVSVDGLPSRSNIWSHGSDARTYFPQQDTAESGVACP